MARDRPGHRRNYQGTFSAIFFIGPNRPPRKHASNVQEMAWGTGLLELACEWGARSKAGGRVHEF